MSSLSRKILVWMAAIGLLPLLVMSVLGYYVGLPAMEQEVEHHLNSSLESRIFSLSRCLAHIRMDLAAASHGKCASGACEGETGDGKSGAPVCHLLNTLISSNKFYRAMALYKTDWTLMAGSLDAAPGTVLSSAIKKLAEAGEFVVSPPSIATDGTIVIQAGCPVFTKEGAVRAYLVATIDLTSAILPFLGDAEGLEKRLKLFLVGVDGNFIVPPRSYPLKSLGPSGLPMSFTRAPYGSVRRYRDWRGTPVLGVAAPLPDTDWVLVAEEDESQAMAYIRDFLLLAALTGLITVAVIFVLASRSSRHLLRPLRELARVARSISQGRRRERVPAFSGTEVREVGEAFNHMLDQIEIHQRNLVNTAALAAVGEFSSSIVHEMRSPLSSIKLNVKALSQRLRGDPGSRELFDIALRQVQRLEAMLSELLSYAKPLSLSLERIDLRAVIRDVMHSLGAVAEAKGLNFLVENLVGDRLIRVDRELLVRALKNLVENAVTWSPPGAAIRIAAFGDQDDPGMFSISVQNDGPEIPEANHARLFRPFFTTREDGVGLGLAYVKKIVGYHGGSVKVDKATGGGAQFTMTFPYAGPPDE